MDGPPGQPSGFRKSISKKKIVGKDRRVSSMVHKLKARERRLEGGSETSNAREGSKRRRDQTYVKTKEKKMETPPQGKPSH